MSSYCTVEIAQQYFDTRLNTDAWDLATSTDRTKALAMATRMIDQLNYVGVKTSSVQVNEFPRDGASVPQAVLDACSEIALALLQGADADKDFESLKITSSAFGTVRSSYDTNVPMDHLAIGIPSTTAWRYLLPYLSDSCSVKLSRV